ncbi:hypothetical protein KL929_004180 [Ogataea haglerorum]|nr:hypothetical protein KL929_004180 [Ogataea haglerorum]
MTRDQLEPVRPWHILHKEKHIFYLCGKGTQHSKAPLLLNTMFAAKGLDWEYQLLDTDDAEAFSKMLVSGKILGCAVTMPNKVTFSSLVDQLTEDARVVGSINTVFARRNSGTGQIVYVGANTDIIGVRDSFLFNETAKKKCLEVRPGLVYGAGGACRAAIYALHTYLGCPKIYVINRFGHEVETVAKSMKQNGFAGDIIHLSTPQEARRVELPKFIVLAVPNVKPQTADEKLAKATLDVFIESSKGSVLEMCYHPVIRTLLYEEFEKNGWNVIPGWEAMIYQGAAQFGYWTGIPLEETPVEHVSQTLRKNLENV